VTGLPLAVSIGDPAGIGPEIILNAYMQLKDAGQPFFVVGGLDVLRACAEEWGDPCKIVAVAEGSEASEVFGEGLPVLAGADATYTPGQPSDEGAALALHSLAEGVRAVLLGKASAVVTAPVSKSQLGKVGFDYPGQTEFLAAVCGLSPEDAVMMLAGPTLRTVPLTVHVALADVPSLISRELIEHKAAIVDASLRRDFGIEDPRLAISGLNPHSGEDGQFGDEEARAIEPAIGALQAKGVNAFGPVPGDALFTPLLRPKYDAALCMYHDQALIPIKAIEFDQGVNVTLGLPIIRTSPDHGTAFDIAGTGKADANAMIAAIRMASAMAQARASAKVADLPPIRETIAKHGLSASKALGQNFLLDEQLLDRIAALPGDLSDARVLEVGPGPGGLTRALLRAGAKVTAIEMDSRCLPALGELSEAFPNQLAIIQGDAMKLDHIEVMDGEPFHVLSNLPYNVGTALFVRWLSGETWPPLWQSLTLMFQREVAERIVAQPGTGAYGRLAVLAQWRSEAKLAMKVHRSAFTPPPKVMSAIVHVTAGESPEGVNATTLERLTEAAFGQRRKMLRQSLKSVSGAIEALEAVGIDPTRRAETVSVEEFVALARKLGTER
jgi:4-hydroxythreonine-4-phosphate dehydrogenase/ribosomal RNA small subunit methyltransferase A